MRTQVGKRHEDEMYETYQVWRKSVGLLPDEGTWEAWWHQQKKIDFLISQLREVRVAFDLEHAARVSRNAIDHYDRTLLEEEKRYHEMSED